MKTDPISAATAYRMALEKIIRAPSLAAAVKAAQQALDISFTAPEEGQLSIHSGYGHRTKTPFVSFSLANPSESANPTIQMRASDARQQAQYILEAAEAAESDGFLVEWLRSHGEIGDQELGMMLADFRAWREKQREDRE